MLEQQRGLTLVELVVTIVLVAIAMVGIALTLNFGTSQSGNTLVELRAVALAQVYLDEILGKRFDENSAVGGIPPCRDPALPGVPPFQECTPEGSFGPEAGETSAPYSRSGFDDVDDYHGLDEGDGGTDPLIDADDNPRSSYANFRVRVNVRYIDVAAMGEPEFGLAVNNEFDDQYDAKYIRVTVNYTGLDQGFEFGVYKANF